MPGDDPLGRPFGGVANSGLSLLHITVIQGHGRGYPASGSSVLSKSSTGRQTSQVRVRAVSTMIQTGIITIARSERPRVLIGSSLPGVQVSGVPNRARTPHPDRGAFRPVAYPRIDTTGGAMYRVDSQKLIELSQSALLKSLIGRRHSSLTRSRPWLLRQYPKSDVLLLFVGR